MKKKLIFLVLTLVLILGVCTATIFAANEPTNLKITAANLSLENAVYMNFKVTHENIDRSDVKLLVWEEYPEAYTKGTEDACLSAKTDVEGNTVFQYTDLSAKDMTKQIYVCAYANIDGVEYYSNSVKYSIAIYAHRMKSTSTDTEFLALIDAMLEYGALSQQYFKYNTDNLPTTEFYQINANGGNFEDNFNIGWYQSGAKATLTANAPEEGYRFSHWENSTGERISENESIEITVSGEENYYAIYKEITSEGLLYEREYDYYVVKGLGDCQDTDIIIPSEYEGLPVCAIGEEAFSDCDIITSVVIPNTISEIRPFAFTGCSNLATVTFKENPSVYFIGWDAFLDCDALTSFTIPNTVTQIENGIFARSENLKTVIFEEGMQLEVLPIDIFNDCPSLKNVTLPDSLKTIGDRAFYKCTAIKTVTIPENVTTIESAAFYYCPALSNITLYNNLQYLGDMAFDTLSNLTITYHGSEKQWEALREQSAPDLFSENTNVSTNYSHYTYKLSADGTYYIITGLRDCQDSDIIIPSEYEGLPVCAIGEEAFSDCDTITSVVIPNTISEIRSFAFKECSNLATVTFQENPSVYFIGWDAFLDCDALTSFTIPNTVTQIENGIFARSENLETVIFEEGIQLEMLPIDIFNDCPSLKNVTLPDSLKAIGDRAFYKCTAIETVTIPENVTTIGNSAFAYCENLQKVSLPRVIDIYQDAFLNNLSLEFVYYNGTLEEWKNLYIENANHGNDPLFNAKLICNEEIIIFPTSPSLAYALVESENEPYYAVIGIGTITDSDIHIPSTHQGLPVKRINGSAFQNITSITSVEIDDGIEHIDSYAFCGCTGITNIEFPTTLIKIGESAFYGCSRLTEFSLPDTLINIERNAFSNCINLLNLVIPGSVKFIGEYAFLDCSSLQKIELNEGLETISRGAFGNLTNLEYINLPSTLKYLGDWVMSKCTLLQSISIPRELEYFGEGAFSNCTNLQSVYFEEGIKNIGKSAFSGCTNLKNIVIPGSIKTIQPYIFLGCNSLESITLSEGIESIGESAFANCTNLLNLYIPGTVYSIEKMAFCGCESLNTITLSEGIKRIEESAFSSLTNLETINLPESLEYLGWGAMGLCTSLKNITLPKGLQYINNSVFSGCTNLQRIDIPEGYQYIDDNAFYGCSNLKSVTIPSSITSIGVAAFYKCGLTSVTIPNGVKTIHAQAFWNNPLRSIYIPSSVSSLHNTAFWNCTSLSSVVIANNIDVSGHFMNCNINYLSVGGIVYQYLPWYEGIKAKEGWYWFYNYNEDGKFIVTWYTKGSE